MQKNQELIEDTTERLKYEKQGRQDLNHILFQIVDLKTFLVRRRRPVVRACIASSKTFSRAPHMARNYSVCNEARISSYCS